MDRTLAITEEGRERGGEIEERKEGEMEKRGKMEGREGTEGRGREEREGTEGRGREGRKQCQWERWKFIDGMFARDDLSIS